MNTEAGFMPGTMPIPAIKDQAEENEREMAELAEKFLASVPAFIEIWDENYKFIDCSQTAAEMFDLSSPSEFISRYTEFSPEFQPCGKSSNEKWIEMADLAFKEGSAQFEWMHLTSNGEPLPVSAKFVRLTIRGKPMIMGYSQDLREINAALEREDELKARLHEQDMLKNAKQQVIEAGRRSYELSQTLIDTAPYMIGIWDEDLSLVGVSQYAIEMFGISDPETFVDRFEDFSPEFQPCGTLSLDKSVKLMNEAYEKGSAKFEWIHLTESGELLPTEIIAKRFTHNGTDMIVTYSRDLRAIKTAEQNEREANELVKLLLDFSPTFIEIWDDQYNLIDCSNQAINFFGVHNRNEFIERYYELSPEYQPCGTLSKDKISAYIDQALKEGTVRFEWMHLTTRGDDLPVEVAFVRHCLKDKNIVIGYNHDLRPIKKAMGEMQRIKIAEESNRAKSAFLARMSHEIRTPLTAIIGISEIELQNPSLSPRAETSFAKIHNSANLLLNIVNDILDLSRIEAGKMELICKEYELASMIVDAANIHIAYAGSKEVKFNVFADKNLPVYLVGDSLRIIQIISNILSNAFKYTVKGEVNLSFSSLKNDDRTDYVTLVVSIQDTGFGMTPEHLEDLSNEYTRCHERDYRTIEGAGLGIPIVFNLVKMMDADINIESKIGVGTNVVISIPQKIASHEVMGDEIACRLGQFKENAKFANKKFFFEPEPMPYGNVLIVDDVEANLYVAKGLMAFYDLNIETCDNGLEAVAKIENGKVYDIVFMDHMMPGINGTEAMLLMRGNGYTQPIVALTANAMIGQSEEFIRTGFDGFISKPIQTKHLDSILTTHIRDKQPAEVIEAARAAKVGGASGTRMDINSFQSDPVLIAKLQADFLRVHSDTFSNICHAIETNDIETAHRLAHTVKGSAGLIFEDSLAVAAKNVEQMLANKKTPTSGQISDLEWEFKRVLAKIGEISEEESSPTDERECLGKEEAVALLDKVAPLLSSQNVACIGMLDELCKVPQSAELCGQIDGFAFMAALETLEKLRDDLVLCCKI